MDFSIANRMNRKILEIFGLNRTGLLEVGRPPGFRPPPTVLGGMVREAAALVSRAAIGAAARHLGKRAPATLAARLARMAGPFSYLAASAASATIAFLAMRRRGLSLVARCQDTRLRVGRRG
jgi:hypothetical protein